MGRWIGAMAAAGLCLTPAHAAQRRDAALEAALLAHIKVLASDDFEGREPGTPGEAKTLRYLGRQWFDIGLVSGTNTPGNEWFAPVTLVGREPVSSSAAFTRKGRRIVLGSDAALMITSGKRSLVRDAPMLFAGKGDGSGLGRNEVAGRVVVLLDGTGEGGAESSERQNALLDAGAAAVLTVLDGERSLDHVAARRQRSGYAIEEDAPGGDLEGFVTKAGMEQLLRGSGTSLSALQADAVRPDFAPRTLDLTATLEATTRETRIKTHNVIGKIPGRRPGTGAVLFIAHWDAFGICAEPPAEDTICNGAVDNASGVAALTEIARRLARAPAMDRDIYFLATTGEELGLLGAQAFTENPPLPLGQIVAAFNIDSNAIAPAGTPLAVVGRGMTRLDSQIAAVARRERRTIVQNDEANAYVKRQDGWALMQHDIPAVLVSSAYGEITRMQAFFDGDYHRPSDDLSKPIELGGAAEDVAFHVALGRWFADAKRVASPAK